MKEIVAPLLEWFSVFAKDLPWRQSPTPYHVWISEIMLQQTRIEAVIPYYERFITELPTVRDLACVPDDRLMKLWEGLGYYSRAKNLKKAAIRIMTEYDGNIPDDTETLKKLSGIGDYTAGAIASIAYGKPTPAVDGNVLRVMARLRADATDILLPQAKKEASALLTSVYPCGTDASHFTQALMELGETVCIPGVPRCEYCPVCAHCHAYGTGTVDKYPVRSAKKERRMEKRSVFLLQCNGKYALLQRKSTGLLAGMWELPNTLQGQEDSLLSPLGLSLDSFTPCGEAKHIFTHIEWYMNGFFLSTEKEIGHFIWKTPAEIANGYAVPTAFRFYLDFIHRQESI